MDSAYSNLLVGGFTKLFASLIHSTVWRADMHVKVVWITLLAMADRRGQVWASLPGLADASRVSFAQCQDALNILSSPDAYSRTKANEGRRIRDIEGGWEIINYLKHRAMRDEEERRLQTRAAVARFRAKKSRESVTVSQRKPRKPKQAQAEAEAEAVQDQDQDLRAFARRAPNATIADRKRQLRSAIHTYLDSHPESTDEELREHVKQVAAHLHVSWTHGRQIAALIDGVYATRKRKES